MSTKGDKLRHAPETNVPPRKTLANLRLSAGKATRWAPSKKANAKQPKKKPD